MSYTDRQFHLSQLQLALKTQAIAKSAALLTLLVSLLLVVMQFRVTGILKRSLMLSSSLVLLYVSKRLADLETMANPYEQIADVQSKQSYQGWLEHSFKPPSQTVELVAPTELQQPTEVKFAPIETALRKPHLMILGETGAGKSTISKYLISQVNAPVLVVDPHATPTDWRGLTVVGSGRNYQAIGLEFERLSKLMNLRYEARDKGITTFEPLILIVDEFPAIASALGKDATNTVKLIAREARKVQIRLCLLSQGTEVKTLGLEGEGSIRECFAMLRLGNFALTHAKTLKDSVVSEVLASSDKPAMLDAYPCNLPILDSAIALPSLPLPSDYLALQAGSDTLLTNSDADTVTPKFDAVDTPLTLVSTSAQPKLSAPLQAILDYAHRQNDYVSARKIQSSIRIFRDTSAKEIRSYFQWLADRGYGTVRGTEDSLEFCCKAITLQ